jgi:6-phosphogluconolactonase (cycloisomerase 2 family)
VKRSRLSGAALVVTALVAAMVASAAYGISTAEGVLGQANFKSCVSDSGADTCADVGVPLDEPTGFAFNDDESRLLVAAHSSDAVAVFKRDRETGQLTELQQSPCISETGSSGVCADGRGLNGARGVAGVGNNAYVASDVSNAIVTITRASGSSGRWEQLDDSKNCITEALTTGCNQGRALTGASSVAGVGSFVYVGGANSIAVFKRDKSKGALAQLDDEAGCIKDDSSEGCFNGSIPGTVTDMMIAKDGKSLYAVDGTAVHVFSRNKSTGVLSQHADAVASNGSGPVGVAADPTGANVYVVASGSGAVDVFSRDKSTGDLTQLAAPNGCVTEDGSGGQCVTASALASLGALTSVFVYKTTLFVYVAGADGLGVLLRNKHTGALTPVGPAPAGCTTETGDGITCLGGKGLGGLTDVVTTGGGKHIFVAGTTFDSVVTLRQGG